MEDKDICKIMEKNSNLDFICEVPHCLNMHTLGLYRQFYAEFVPPMFDFLLIAPFAVSYGNAYEPYLT